MSSLPPNLPSLVRQKYSSAVSSGALIFSPTEVSILPTVPPFQLRFCPSLAKKPTPNTSNADSIPKDKKPFDPFASPPSDLLVATLPSHNLVLNKFPIIEGHTILATSAFEPQTGPLTPSDLSAVYSVLKAYTDAGSRAVGFFNSGPSSGASQARRHIQLLPVESVVVEGWGMLIDSILSHGEERGELLRLEGLQLWHAATRLNSTNAEELQSAYEKLLVAAFGPRPEGGWEGVTRRESYNLAFSGEGMGITRRTKGEYDLEGKKLSINGTILVGTLMVKGEEEWELLKREPGRLEEVLRGISGGPSTAGKDKL